MGGHLPWERGSTWLRSGWAEKRWEDYFLMKEGWGDAPALCNLENLCHIQWFKNPLFHSILTFIYSPKSCARPPAKCWEYKCVKLSPSSAHSRAGQTQAFTAVESALTGGCRRGGAPGRGRPVNCAVTPWSSAQGSSFPTSSPGGQI